MVDQKEFGLRHDHDIHQIFTYYFWYILGPMPWFSHHKPKFRRFSKVRHWHWVRNRQQYHSSNTEFNFNLEYHSGFDGHASRWWCRFNQDRGYWCVALRASFCTCVRVCLGSSPSRACWLEVSLWFRDSHMDALLWMHQTMVSIVCVLLDVHRVLFIFVLIVLKKKKKKTNRKAQCYFILQYCRLGACLSSEFIAELHCRFFWLENMLTVGANYQYACFI